MGGRGDIRKIPSGEPRSAAARDFFKLPENQKIFAEIDRKACWRDALTRKKHDRKVARI
jgi:hypothetical protein